MNMSRCLGTNYRLRELHRNYLCICYNSATCGAIEECIYAHSTNLASTVSFCLSLFILHTQIPWIAACNINICSCNISKKSEYYQKKTNEERMFLFDVWHNHNFIFFCQCTATVFSSKLVRVFCGANEKKWELF